MTCDLCHQQIVDPYVDGKMNAGPWATMCRPCHKQHGVGLGLGRGQVFNADGTRYFPEKTTEQWQAERDQHAAAERVSRGGR